MKTAAIDPVLNELSLEPAEVPTASRMVSLVAVLRRLDELGFPRVMRHVRSAKDREIETGRSLHVWLFQNAPKDLRLFIAGRMSKAPFVEDLHEAREGASGALFQALCDGEPAVGPGVAYLLDAPSVALGGLARWEVDPLTIVLTQMDAESDAVVEQSVDVVHLSRAEQVAPREVLLRERVLRVADGDQLWDRRSEMFRRLIFCDCVEIQVRSLSGREFYFQQVVCALARLDKALASWNSGAFHPGMDSSSESRPTLEHGTFGAMREFHCPDGQTRQFSNHLKLFSNNWRIYYLEVKATDVGPRAFVGYVGKHLPTMRFRT